MSESLNQERRGPDSGAATKGIQNVGTPHDWEDYEKYKKELDDDTTD